MTDLAPWFSLSKSEHETYRQRFARATGVSFGTGDPMRDGYDAEYLAKGAKFCGLVKRTDPTLMRVYGTNVAKVLAMVKARDERHKGAPPETVREPGEDDA